tara:strand:- start:297 stop:1478 length:1182 start_codon:yes stop_codon:yes gene_type:complete
MNIKYLVGDGKVTNRPSELFGAQECNFLEKLSLKLNNISNIHRYPDIKTAAFWCRKKNIEKLKKETVNGNLKIGIGKIFHITPSNVPTNFFYSMIMGLLTGNSNIVKVPTKEFDQVKIICNAINSLIKNNTFIKKRISIIQYDYSKIDITKRISENCNGRIIWGGDKSINEIKNLTTKTKCIDVIFPDRYSLALLNANKIFNLSNSKIKKLARDFYNDTFFYDQNACTSPHLILWVGNSNIIEKAKKKFWTNVIKEVKENFTFTNYIASEKLNHLYNLIAEHKDLGNFKNYENLIYVFENTKISNDIHNIRGKWGIFFEQKINHLNTINKYINEKFQTLTYFGFEKEYFKKFINEMKPVGIDRIVPIGRSMEMNFFWDGYDLKNILTRSIEIK